MHTYHTKMHKKVRGPDYSRPKGHLCNTIQLFLKFSFKIKYTEHDTSKRSSILWLKIIMVLWKSVMPACHFISPVWWFHYQKKPHPKLWKSNEMAHIQGTLCSLYWLQYWFYITVYSGWLSPSHQRLIIYWILIVTGAEFFFLFFVKLYPRTQFSLLCVCTVCSCSRSSWQKSGSVVLGWKLHTRNTSVCVLLNCVCSGGFGRLSSRFVPTCFCFLAGLLCVGCFCDGIKPNRNAEVLFIHECCMCKCYFISVRRINWVWLARKAHQPTRESKEVTKMK